MLGECLYAYRNPKNTKHWRLSWFRYETFIYILEFKVFRHEERESQFLTMLTVCPSSVLNSLSEPTRGHPVDPNWSRLGELRKTPRPIKVQISTKCFFSNPKILSYSLLGMTSFTSPVSFLSGVLIVTSVIVTSSQCAHEHLHSMCAPN